MKKDPITPNKMDELLRFLPLFNVPERKFIEEWRGYDKRENRAMALPYPVYSNDVEEFFQLAGQPCWSDYDYCPEEASRMVQEDELIKNASIQQIKTMLTFCVRGERFCDGHWGDMLESGRVVTILKRLEEIRTSMK